jgi:hypothetical protein
MARIPVKKIFATASVIAFFVLLAGQHAFCGEMLINENFDALKLDQLPPGWSRAQPNQLSLVDEPGRGKVLKIVNNDDRYPYVMATLEPGKASGKEVTISVAAKFPGTYVPKAENLTASPKVIFKALDNGNKTLVEEALVPQASKPDWQNLTATVNVPADAVNVSVSLCIQFVTCEVYFDNLTIEAKPGPGAPAVPAPVAVAPNPTATNPAVKAPPVPAPAPAPVPVPAVALDKVPKKTLEDGGILFGPDYVKTLQKTYPSKNVNPALAMFVGPGFTEKDASPKIGSGWKVVPPSVKLVGAQAAPRALLALLPEVLVKEKPEVVFISGDLAPGRKPTTTEADDWDDVARLCVRLDALPIMVLHPNDNKDELFDRIFQGIRRAVDVNTMLAVTSIPQETFGKRAGVLLKLLDTYVFMRVKPNDPTKTPGKVIDE